jgi:acetyl esterase
MKLDESAQALIEITRQQGNRPMSEITVEAARAQSNALRSRLQPEAPELDQVRDGVIAGDGPEIPFRLYKKLSSTEAEPVVVFFHGGGFVLGDLDSHDVVCRLLCEGSGCTVIAIDYRRAPEHPFPAAVDDALSATLWVRRNAATLGVDPKRMALAGDSAGANLATVTALAMKRQGLEPAALQILMYPVTDQHGRHESKERFATGYLLTRASLDYYASQYLPRASDRHDWRASPLLAEALEGLPEALVLTAGFDPLVDEGEAYALRLAQAGVRTTLRRFPGQVHGFVTRGKVIPEAQEAIDEATALLRARFFQKASAPIGAEGI